KAGHLIETPKKFAPNIVNRLIGSNSLALAVAETTAQRLGYRTLNRGTVVQGETRIAAGEEGDIFTEFVRGARHPDCLLSGGETTVTRTGAEGSGGRNQEYVLGAMLHLGNERMREVVIASLATDGEDGPTDAAGALADSGTLAKALGLGLDAHGMLVHHDA